MMIQELIKTKTLHSNPAPRGVGIGAQRINTFAFGTIKRSKQDGIKNYGPDSFCLINITRTKNNTHSTISNLFGKVKTKWSISAGQLTTYFQSKGRRKTRLSQRLVYKSCVSKALGLGYKLAVIHCKGDRGSKTRIYRTFSDALTVLLLRDTTGTSHNGCRPPKVRRI